MCPRYLQATAGTWRERMRDNPAVAIDVPQVIFTNVERTVLTGMLDQRTVTELSDDLELSPAVILDHMRNISSKIGLAARMNDLS